MQWYYLTQNAIMIFLLQAVLESPLKGQLVTFKFSE